MHQQLEQLVSRYDQGVIDRRQLLERLFTLLLASGASRESVSAPSREPLLRARSLNHVTLYATDFGRSKSFYQHLTGLTARDEGEDFCEFRLEGGFLGLYAHAREPQRRVGFDHFCFGIDGYDAATVYATLKESLPDAQPTLEYDGKQVYVRDPDGVRVQVADVTYKR
jgi:catechol 2,3-dioxygenase-like lactoylglutathione lyase family enzyme